MILNESNVEIEKLVKYLDSLMGEFGKKYPNSESLIKLIDFNENVIAPWVERYLFLKEELDQADDEEMKNQILDWVNEINKYIKGSK